MFKHLFSPIRIGTVDVKNRLVCLPHGTMFAENGLPSETHLGYYSEKAKGGVGLIIMEISQVHPTSKDMLGLIRGYDKDCVAKYRRITESVHSYDCRIFSQIGHTGRQTNSMVSERPLWAPSAIECPVVKTIPHEMDIEEIHEIINSYAEVAERIRCAGFDGVEIHSAHGGYLIQEFLSPFSNRRSDEFGGSLENRMRFLKLILTEVRRRVGNDYTVGLRISGDEFVPGGLTIVDVKQIVKHVTALNMVDYVNQSMGSYASLPVVLPDNRFPSGCFAYLAGEIKKETTVPVIASGRINDPLLAEKILDDGMADLIGMARGLIADPHLPRKAREGKLDEVRPCVGCCECLNRIFKELPLRCIHNPSAGREIEYGNYPGDHSSREKKILVVGGGVAGMKVAEVARENGHDVTLIEKEADLGGKLNHAVRVATREELVGIKRYLEGRLRKLRVDVIRGTALDVDGITRFGADCVVIATGAKSILPDALAGKTVSVWTIDQLFEMDPETGNNVVFVDGGFSNWESCSAIEYLAEKGKNVTVVTSAPFLGSFIPFISLAMYYKSIFSKNVRVCPNERPVEIAHRTLIVENIYSAVRREIGGVDSIVVNMGRRAEDGLLKSLKATGSTREVFAVGDAYAPGGLMMAISEAERLGRSIS